MTDFTVGDDDFLLDGRPVRLLSGALHYFRVHEEQWDHRLAMLAAMGLNCVETYVPWNLHEPRAGGVPGCGGARPVPGRGASGRGCGRSCARVRTSAPSGRTAGCRSG